MHKITLNCRLCVFLETTVLNILSYTVNLSLNAQLGTHRLINTYTCCLRAAFVSVISGRGSKSAAPVSQQNPQNTFQQDHHLLTGCGFQMHTDRLFPY